LPGLPSLCHKDSDRFLRFPACYNSGWTVAIYNTQTGQILGKVRGSTTFWNTLSYKSRIWAENIDVIIDNVTGEGAGTTFTAPLVCNDPTNGDCQRTGSGSWAGQTRYLPANKGDVYPGELGFGSAAHFTTNMYFSVNMVFDNPAGSSPLNLYSKANIRCDSEPYFKPTKGGCVYSNYYENELKLSAKDPAVAEAAKFIESAQKAIPSHIGEPGHFGMTRLTNKAKIRKNRRVACKGVHPRKGQSCDEYPFASTNQGAALVHKGYYKSEPVNAKQNSKVGTLLGTFYLQNRIMAHTDPFVVKINS
jgi:hypothetical protein